MTKFLIRLFVKDSESTSDPAVRQRYGKLAGGVGIASNLLLFIMKIAIGLFSGSLSIMADAVNNLSDCASSLIALAGFALAARPADDEHPYGHARYEYISGFVVSFLILVVGLQFLLSSIDKIANPEPVQFNALLVIILIASILIKLWQGLFNRNLGQRIDSDTLRATAADSRNDVIATAAVLLGAIVGHLSGLLIDGWMGLAVAAFILVSGVRMVIDTLNPLLGMAPDKELVAKIDGRIREYDSVLGTHDMIVHNYGPGRVFVSVHVEVPAKQDILISHEIIDNIERDISNEMGIDLVIHLDPLATDDQLLSSHLKVVIDAVEQIDPALSVHDFRMTDGKTRTNLIFDVVVPPKYHLTDSALRSAIGKLVIGQLGDNYYCAINIDKNYTTTWGKVR